MNEAKKITLAGEEYEIPVLAPKQNRIIVPLLDSCTPKILEARRGALIDPADETKGVIPYKWITGVYANGAYDEMCAIVSTALTRIDPEMTRARFDEMPVDVFELISAITPISYQAGLLRTSPAKPKE